MPTDDSEDSAGQFLTEHDFVDLMKSVPVTAELPEKTINSCFTLMDKNMDSTLDFQEFDSYFVAANLVAALAQKDDVHSVALVAAAYWEMDLAACAERIHDMPWLAHEEQTKIEALETAEEKMKALSRALDNHAETPLGVWSLNELDNVTITVMIIQMFLMCLWASFTDPSWERDATGVLMSLFSLVWYPIEQAIRILRNGLDNFWWSPDPEVRMGNRAGLCLVCISSLSAVCHLTEARPLNLWRCGIAAVLWRVVVLQNEFRTLVFSLGMVYKPLGHYTTFMLVIFIQFALVGFILFEGTYIDGMGQDPFDTVESSMITFISITIGNWESTISPITDATNYAAMWFFVSYILLVCVLFANLFVGIIISYQRSATEELGSLTGKAQIKFTTLFDGIPKERQREVIFMAGKIEVFGGTGEKVVQQHVVAVAVETLDGTALSAHELTLTIRLQASFRRIHHSRMVEDMRRARLFLASQSVDFGKVLSLIHLAHGKADFNNNGTIDNQDELITGAKFLLRILGMQSTRVKFPAQYLAFCITNVANLKQNPMPPFIFAVWFFREFLLEATMQFRIALPRKFFFLHDDLEPPMTADILPSSTPPETEQALAPIASATPLPSQALSLDGEEDRYCCNQGFCVTCLVDCNEESQCECCAVVCERHMLSRQLFARYDLDRSGDLNSLVELEQLTTNLLYKLKKNHTQAEILAVLAASPACTDENRWSMAQYIAWFDGAFFTANH